MNPSSMRAILCAVTLAILTIDSASSNLTLKAEHLSDNEKLEEIFSSFVQQNARPYNNSTREVYSLRKAIFKQNMLKVLGLNKKERGSAKFGMSIFADRTEQEFKRLLGYKPKLTKLSTEDDNGLVFDVLFSELLNEEKKSEKELLESMPLTFDWRAQEGVVSSVKDQGKYCGSCWAFAATGSIEGQYKVKKGITVSLSEQNLIDCDRVDQGCNGGLPELAYKQVMRLGGLETEADYAYRGNQSECNMNKSHKKYTIDNFTHLTPNDEKRMKIWLAKRGPISVAIDAESIGHYEEGVYLPNEGDCSKEPRKLNHAVLIVGFGVDEKHEPELPYWIVKNSWGSEWGEGGYFRLYRGMNACGVADDPTTALLLTEDTEEIEDPVALVE